MTIETVPQCPRARVDALLYASGEMEARSVAGFHHHVAGCAECDAVVARQKRLAGLWTVLPVYAPADTVLESISMAARQSVLSTSAGPWYRRLWGAITEALEWRPSPPLRLMPAAGWALAVAFLMLAGHATRSPDLDPDVAGSQVLAWSYESSTDESADLFADGDIFAESYIDFDEAFSVDLIALDDEIGALSETIDQF
jgi:hypothetical protein